MNARLEWGKVKVEIHQVVAVEYRGVRQRHTGEGASESCPDIPHPDRDGQDAAVPSVGNI